MRLAVGEAHTRARAEHANDVATERVGGAVVVVEHDGDRRAAWWNQPAQLGGVKQAGVARWSETRRRGVVE